MDRIRVLVVDDDQVIRQLLARVLESHVGFCEVAASGQEALNILGYKEFDVMVTDLSMPGMNGLELISRVREKYPYMVNMMLTGGGSREDTILAIKYGVFDFIEKPVTNMDSFRMAVRRAAERSILTRERDELLRALQCQNQKLQCNLATLSDAYERLIMQDQTLKADLAGAQRMQQSLLPAAFPSLAGLDLFGYYRPYEFLGGDFFDFIPLGEGRVAVYLADVAGHGVRAAMVTVIVHELIRGERLLHPENNIFESPVRTFDLINQGLLNEDADSQLHVTMTYVMVDCAKGMIEYGNAGHPCSIFLRGSDGQVRLLKTTGPALGLSADSGFESLSLPFEPGDSIVLYSDGLIEARNPKNEELGLRPLLAKLEHNKTALTPSQLAIQMEQTLTHHQQGTASGDDISFVIINRQPSAQPAQPGLEPAQPSVKIVNNVKSRGAAASNAQMAMGWGTNCSVIRLSGQATWKIAHTLRELTEESMAARVKYIYLDLTQCLSMDSTMLGMLYQLAAMLVIAQPSEKLRHQFEELGIAPYLTISQDPPPPVTLIEPPASPVSKQEQSMLMLTSHEALIEASEDNRRQFESVVELLRKDLEMSHH